MFINYIRMLIPKKNIIDRIEDKLDDFFDKVLFIIWKYWMILLFVWWEIRFYKDTRSKYDIILDSHWLIVRIFRCIFC